MRRLLPAGIVLLLYAIELLAQPSLQASFIEGTAKVQRAGKRTWEELKNRDKIMDNDIVETFFQTTLAIDYGGVNSIVMGSNTKALFNITARSDGESVDFNTTIFAGGVFVKVVRNSHVGIFTSHGVAQIDSGAISAVVEAKTGLTGFQMLGGRAEVRNIAQQDAHQLTVGQTTVIRPGKAPTAPLYITYRHVAVLKHFFGDEYIERALLAGNITPTEDKSGEKPRFTADLNARRQSDGGIYKTLFNLNKIYGSIINERQSRLRSYLLIRRNPKLFNSKAVLAVNAAFGIANQGVYPMIVVAPSFAFSFADIGVRLALARNYSKPFDLNITGIAGILDKIDHVMVRLPGDSSAVSVNAIEDLTLGNGFIVRHFNSCNTYSAIRPLGLNISINKDFLHTNLFVADLSGFSLGGVHVGLTPGLSYFGAGFYYDINQRGGAMNGAHSRFIEMPPDSIVTFRDPGAGIANINIYELNFGFDIVNVDELRMGLMFEFAQKILSARTDGLALSLPGWRVEWLRFKAGASFQIQTKRMLINQFHHFYMSNRQRQVYSSNDSITLWSQNNYLSEHRVARGFTLNLGANMLRGTELEFNYSQDFNTLTPFTTSEKDSLYSKNDFSFDIAFRVNQELLHSISYAEIIVRQVHGGYFPSGGFSFASWGFGVDLTVETIPLIANIAFEAGLRFSYIDLDTDRSTPQRFNNNLGPGDLLFDIFLGGRWGFL
jgi:hypothetical protein